MGHRWAGRVGVTAVVCLWAVACVGPSRTAEDYREKAANTAEAAGSAVETARMVAGAAGEGKATQRYTSLVLSEAEVDVRSIAESFESVQPPGREVDELRSQLAEVLTRCATTLSNLRIAAYRGDTRELVELARELPVLSAELGRFAELRPT